MTQDDVLRLAKEAGIYHAQDSEYHWDGITDVQIIERTPDSAKDMEWRERRIFEILERYTKLVTEHEQKEIERLKALCDEMLSELYVYRASEYLKDVTASIKAGNKARGEQA